MLRWKKIFAIKSTAAIVALMLYTSFQSHLNELSVSTSTDQKLVVCRDEADGHFEQEKSYLYTRRESLWQLYEDQLRRQAKEKRLPDLIGVGVEKCGTHALHNFLRPHPLIATSTPIETHFFTAFTNISAYREKFPAVGRSVFLMEKTPAYFSYPPHTIPRLIHEHVPNAKILLILCEPAKRAFSDFIHEHILCDLYGWSAKIKKFDNFTSYLDTYIHKVVGEVGYIQPTLFSSEDGTVDAKFQLVQRLNEKDSISSILTNGFYAPHLSRWLKYFNDTNLMIIDGEELFNDPGTVIERVQDFAGMPKLLLRNDYVRDPEKSSFFCYKRWQDNKLQCLSKEKARTRGNLGKKSTEADLKRLKRIYRAFNEVLFKMIHRKFKWGY